MNYFVDTGPLAAYLDERDSHHHWVATQFSRLEPPFITCEAVISETVFLLQSSRSTTEGLFELISRDLLIVQPAFIENDAQNRISQIVNTYRNLPADFADACLVRMAETHNNPDFNQIITVDDDFFIYRSESGDPISLIHPLSGR